MSTDKPGPKLILLMGVAGSGKTRLGRRLAERLGYAFLDADDFHSAEAIARMRSGAHLSDAMRDAWVDRLQLALTKLQRSGANCVLAFSGLRVRHRRQLMKLGFVTRAFMLEGNEALLRQRIERRADHFMPASQLPDQLERMEQIQRDEGIEPFDIRALPETIVDALIAKLAQ